MKRSSECGVVERFFGTASNPPVGEPRIEPSVICIGQVIQPGVGCDVRQRRAVRFDGSNKLTGDPYSE